MEIIKNSTSVIYKTSTRSKERVGRVDDFEISDIGLRYKVYRKQTGRFLNGKTMWEAFNKQEHTIVDTRWVFFMWMKPERIIRVL